MKTERQGGAGTFDVKSWQQWKHEDNLCPACKIYERNIKHLIKCTRYERHILKHIRFIYLKLFKFCSKKLPKTA